MKKSIVFIASLLLNSYSVYSQEIINNTGTTTNEVIQQINVPTIDGILSFQSLNRGISNYVLAQQTGNENSVRINQRNDASTDMSNQTYTVQTGNSNELTIGQIGSGNLLLGFQLGYLATLASTNTNSEIGTAGIPVFDFASLTNGNAILLEGERNKLIITQNGNNNAVMAVQQGTDNSIVAEQVGNNNYLVAMQKGTNNIVSNYKQENTSDQNLFDRIIQIGDNLSITTGGSSNTSSIGKTLIQTGENLALVINNDLVNSVGGVEINQTGTDMKVVIDQSFFSFPLK